VEVFSPIAFINHAIAIDPVEYIRIPLSLDDFEPDGNIINNDGMPSKPSLPSGSVLGFQSHFITPSFWFADKRR
jgi:hypothetical protein